MSESDRIVELLLKIIERQEALDAKIDDHVAREEGMLVGVATAFPLRPDGKPDFAGHQSYHAALIEAAKERAVLYRDLRAEAAERVAVPLVALPEQCGKLALAEAGFAALRARPNVDHFRVEQFGALEQFGRFQALVSDAE